MSDDKKPGINWRDAIEEINALARKEPTVTHPIHGAHSASDDEMSCGPGTIIHDMLDWEPTEPAAQQAPATVRSGDASRPLGLDAQPAVFAAPFKHRADAVNLASNHTRLADITSNGVITLCQGVLEMDAYIKSNTRPKYFRKPHPEGASWCEHGQRMIYACKMCDQEATNALPQAAFSVQPSNEDCGPAGGAPMQSDTPETDAAYFLCYGDAPDYAIVRAEVARKLERERDALQKSLDQLHGRRFSERNYTALHSRAEKAEAELAAAKSDAESWSRQCSDRVKDWDEMRQKFEEANKRAEDAEKDAKRYRDFRKIVSSGDLRDKKWKRAYEMWFAKFYPESDLDGAIDEAMK